MSLTTSFAPFFLLSSLFLPRAPVPVQHSRYPIDHISGICASVAVCQLAPKNSTIGQGVN